MLQCYRKCLCLGLLPEQGVDGGDMEAKPKGLVEISCSWGKPSRCKSLFFRYSEYRVSDKDGLFRNIAKILVWRLQGRQREYGET
jgi:hypothetical protein